MVILNGKVFENYCLNKMIVSLKLNKCKTSQTANTQTCQMLKSHYEVNIYYASNINAKRCCIAKTDSLPH